MENYQKASVKQTNTELNKLNLNNNNIKNNYEKLSRRRIASWVISKNMTKN